MSSSGSGKTRRSAENGSQLDSKKEYLFKILVIGELGAGKTSIIKQYVHQYFSQHYRATIGVDFALKILNWDENTVVRVQLWDIAGQERYGNMTRVYYKEAVGCILVFDVTRPQSFEAVLKWKMDLDAKVTSPDGHPIPCLLMGNKCDQAMDGFYKTGPEMDAFCNEHGFIGWFEVSAKENINIEQSTRFLLSKVLENAMTDSPRNTGNGTIDLERTPNRDSPSKSGCCN